MENKLAVQASLALVALLPAVSTAAPSVKDRLAEVRAIVAQSEQGLSAEAGHPVPKFEAGFANAPQP